MRKGQFCWSRMFIHMLADLEKQRIELEKFIEILLTWNIKKRDASSSPQPEPPISKGEFFKEISVDQKNRYKLAFFNPKCSSQSPGCGWLVLLLRKNNF